MEETQSLSTQQEEPGKRVTALIVSYNNANGLHRLIRSLDASAGRDHLEILVIDLASTDGSGQADSDFPGVTVLRLAKHFGATKAMNIATRTAAGEYVFYLDPGVEVTPNVVQQLADYLDTDSDAGAVCPQLVTPGGEPASQAFRMPDRNALTKACERGMLPPVALSQSEPVQAVDYASRRAIMVRRRFVQGMNFFDSRYGHNWADLELAFQIRKAQKKTLILTAATAVWHEPPASLDLTTAMTADRWLGAAAYLEKREGFGPAFGFRMSGVMKALLSFNFGLLSALISGQIVDGTQGEFR